MFSFEKNASNCLYLKYYCSWCKDNVLTVDGLVAILALSWSPAAAATKVSRETRTLEMLGNYENCKLPSIKSIKVFNEGAWWKYCSEKDA